MSQFPLVGPTYQDESIAVDAQLTMNWYPQLNDSRAPGGSAKASLYGTPGKILAATAIVAPGTPAAGCCIVPADNFVFPDGVTIVAWMMNGPTLGYLTVLPGTGGQQFVFTYHNLAYLVNANTGPASKPILGLPGQLFPSQIIVLNPTLLFIVANGGAFIASFGAEIATYTIGSGAAAGTGYAVGDTFTLIGGTGIDATGVVTSLVVGPSGGVLTATISPPNTGYTVGQTYTAVGSGTQPGVGIGLQVTVTAVNLPAWLTAQVAIPSSDIAFDNYIQSATFMDGYVIVSMAPNSAFPLRRQFFVSGLNDPSFWDPLEVGSKEANPDPVVAVFSAYELLGVFGTQTFEEFYDSGQLQFQFTRVAGGGLIEAGLASPWCICKSDGTITWLGTDNRGTNIAWQLRGLTPVRISTHAIENAWRNYNVSAASIYSYQENGHFFVVFHFPIPDTTWAFDSTTQMWHRRCSLDGAGAQHADYGRYHAFVQNIGHLTQDYNNGNIYLSSIDYYQENGANITRIRRTPHFRNELRRIAYHRVRLLMETGGVPSAGANPQIALRYSKDGGNTWSNYFTIPIGLIGAYTQLVQWLVQDYGRDFVFEFSSTAAIKQTLIEGYVEFDEALNHD